MGRTNKTATGKHKEAKDSDEQQQEHRLGMVRKCDHQMSVVEGHLNLTYQWMISIGRKR